ncbi:MAG: glucoamylase family protein [Mangrovibacterium sp.]
MKELKTLLLLLFCFFSLLGCQDASKSDSLNREFVLSKEDSILLDKLQKQTFEYFWSGALPNSGLAAERIHVDGIYPQNDQNIVTTGGSGFGLMAILVGLEHGWITKDEALGRYEKILCFLENADRFHGAWAHWMYDETGKAKPFGEKDNGGDLVETAFLMQGLLTVAEYYRGGSESELSIVNRIQKLYEDVDWHWYTQGGQNVLYWHWSPEYAWGMNFPVHGYNECLIMYVLAASSPTHSISKEVYDEGWARGGAIVSNDKFYGLPTILKFNGGKSAPLFWAHYSYLGLDPRNLSDAYANYWKLNRNQAYSDYLYCVDNPQRYKGYSEKCWGLTASYTMDGYTAHSPRNDRGVISPTAALSSMPYMPKETMAFIRFLYNEHPEYIGKYGPYDAFSMENNWLAKSYLAIDQGPIPVMIENYRSGLLWNLFMKNKDVQRGLKKLGYTTKSRI